MEISIECHAHFPIVESLFPLLGCQRLTVKGPDAPKHVMVESVALLCGQSWSNCQRFPDDTVAIR